MSQALMDYVTARHDAIAAVLEMLTAEHRLSDEMSSVIDVTDAECAVDGAARKLAEAVDVLPRDRRPAGWGEPAAVAGIVRAARVRFIKAVLRCLTAEYGDPRDGEYDRASDQLALAARNLAADAEAQRAAKAEAGGRLL